MPIHIELHHRTHCQHARLVTPRPQVLRPVAGIITGDGRHEVKVSVNVAEA